MKTLSIVVVAALCILCLLHGPVSAQEQLEREELFLIRGLLRDGLVEVAARRAIAFTRTYPDSPRREALLIEVADPLLETDYLAAQTDLLQRYLELFPDGRRATSFTFHLGKTLYQQREYAAALPLLQSMLTDSELSRSSRLQARTMVMESLVELWEFETLTEQFSETEGLGAEEDYYLATSLVATGNEAEAEAIIGRASGKRPSPEILFDLQLLQARLLLRQARWQELSALSPPPEAHLATADGNRLQLYRAIALERLNRPEEAVELILPQWQEAKQAIDRNEPMPYTFLALREREAALQMFLDRFNLAETVEQKHELGRIIISLYGQSGNRQQAHAFAVELAALIQGDQAAHMWLLAAEFAENHMDKKAALERAGAAATAPSLRIRALFKRAILARNAGDLDEAERLFSQIADAALFDQEVDLALLKLADITAQQGRVEAAQSFLRLLLQRLPAAELTLQARILLARLQSAVLDSADQTGLGWFTTYPLPWQIPATVWNKLFHQARLGTEPWETAQLAWLLGDQPLEDLLLLVPEDSLRIDMLASHAEKNPALLPVLLHAAAGKNNELVFDTGSMLFKQSSQPYSSTGGLYAAEAAIALGDTATASRILISLYENATEAPLALEAQKRLRQMAIQQGSAAGALQYSPDFLLYAPDLYARAEARLPAARRAFDTGDWTRAGELYEGYPLQAGLEPDDRFRYGASLFYTGKVKEAAAVLQPLSPDGLPDGWRQIRLRALAEADRAAGKVQDALTVYRSLLKEPLSSDRRFELLLAAAESALQLDNYEQAAAWYDELLNLGQSTRLTPQQYAVIARCFVEAGRVERAIQLYGRLQLQAESVDQGLEYAFEAAELTARLEGPEAGAEAYLTIAYRNARRGTWPARARFQAAILFEQANRIEQAIRQYRLIAEQHPQTTWGTDASARLRELLLKRREIDEEPLRPPGSAF